ncbi:MAG TPA: hydroxysqualene dehydroxylase HpnE [Rhizomicrobium sp.]|nr:hydroxysqualene dehydroxylase HpnE [Rhizomicrobium sp.]
MASLPLESGNRRRAFVIGAGIAGLAAATRLAGQGVAVTLYEAAGQAGGRCRSYYDPALDQTIDNGNHLVLSGNKAVHRYLRRIGPNGRLAGPGRAYFPFTDLKSGARWLLKLNRSPLPWWITARSRRVPGTGARDYLPYARLMFAGRKARIADVVPTTGLVWDRLMRPFLLAALNTDPETASAQLAGQVIRETLARGGHACRPRIATPNLSSVFIDPALSFLERNGAKVEMGKRLRTLVFGAHAVLALEFPDMTVPLNDKDMVILAVPPFVAKEFLPQLSTPTEFRSIVNGHFNFPAPKGAPTILGVIGGTAEWIFSFEDRISVTVSGADAIVDRDREELAKLLWRDVCAALRISDELPRWQIVKEKRATFAATPEQDMKRPGTKTACRNLFLAGDWTDTALPATLEGAIRSGEAAASLALKRLAL